MSHYGRLIVIMLQIFLFIHTGGVVAVEEKPWNITMTGTISGMGDSILIAVIDTGMAEIFTKNNYMSIWHNNDEIPSNGLDDDDNGYIDDISGWDFVNDDNDPSDDNFISHGTHVSGILADPNIGMGGNISLMNLKALDNEGNAQFSNVARAIRYATDNGARIISMSLGGPDGNSELLAAIQYAHSNDVLLIAASGNDGRGSIDYPAKYNEVISVGSVDQLDRKSSFSNYGQELELVAPGEAINSTVREDMGYRSELHYNNQYLQSIPLEFTKLTNGTQSFLLIDGKSGTIQDIERTGYSNSLVLIERGGEFKEIAVNIKQTGNLGMIIYNCEDIDFAGTMQSFQGIYGLTVNNEVGKFLLSNTVNQTVELNISTSNYFYNSGTSMAVPHVTGLAAQLMSVHNLNSTRTRYVLQYSANNEGKRNIISGYGVVNASRAEVLLSDIEIPQFTAKLIRTYENSLGTIDFEIQINMTDNFGLMELNYQYYQSESIIYRKMLLVGEKNLSMIINPVMTPDLTELIVEVELRDVSGNGQVTNLYLKRSESDVILQTYPFETSTSNSISIPSRTNFGILHVVVGFSLSIVIYLRRKQTRKI